MNDDFTWILGLIICMAVFCTVFAIFDYTSEKPKEVYAHCPNCGWEGYYNETIPDTGSLSGSYLCPKCMYPVDKTPGELNR